MSARFTNYLATVKGSITEISVTELAALGHFSESSSAASLPPNTHLVDVRCEMPI